MNNFKLSDSGDESHQTCTKRESNLVKITINNNKILAQHIKSSSSPQPQPPPAPTSAKLYTDKVSPKMVLEHQGLLAHMQGPGLQPALQLYAAAAQLAPRSRVPPWAPFLQFGAPGLFGNPFLARPRFPAGTAPSTAAALNGLAAGLNGLTGISHPGISPQRTSQGPPSEDSNDDRGRLKKSCRRYF